VRPHDGLVDLEVGGRTRQALDVDTPLLAVETESLKGALLAKKLDGINVLVTTVVAGTGVTLGVLVRHGRTKGIEDGAGCDILGSNEEDGLALTLDLTFHDLSDLLVSVHQGLLHEVLVGLGERVVGHLERIDGGENELRAKEGEEGMKRKDERF
jgi:hypothetical protein